MSTLLVPLVSLLVTAAIIGLLFLVLVVDTGRRGKTLSATARDLGLDYRPYASISNRIRDAHFAIIESGQFRHFRHLLEGTFRQRSYVSVFDYSVVMPEGTSTQSLLLLACPLPGLPAFAISKSRWLSHDAFSEGNHYRLQPLRTDQKPLLLRQWQVLSRDPQRLWPRLTPTLCDWLLAHPHLHIEWSDGILLVCRPGHILAPEHMGAAIEHAESLARLLQSEQ
ncbi:hypothetical protein ACQUQU_10445 [Thalassolituus sp. LLYu03]|uniref:hypothetical protein n=1 Tax=Thalassolituus sp. LLYu03 TaxID=3421656 RepID=UPI003D290FA5